MTQLQSTVDRPTLCLLKHMHMYCKSITYSGLLGVRLLECTRSSHIHQSSSRSWRRLCIECGVRVLVRRSVHPVPESCHAVAVVVVE